MVRCQLPKLLLDTHYKRFGTFKKSVPKLCLQHINYKRIRRTFLVVGCLEALPRMGATLDLCHRSTIACQISSNVPVNKTDLQEMATRQCFVGRSRLVGKRCLASVTGNRFSQISAMSAYRLPSFTKTSISANGSTCTDYIHVPPFATTLMSRMAPPNNRFPPLPRSPYAGNCSIDTSK